MRTMAFKMFPVTMTTTTKITTMMTILEEGCGQPLHLFVEITYRLQSIIYVVKLGQEGLKTTNMKI